MLEKEIPPAWKNKKSYPIIPFNRYEGFRLIKWGIKAGGGQPILLLWNILNLPKED